MGGSDPRHLHVEVAFIHLHDAFQNPCRNWRRNLTSMARGTLYHHRDNVLRIVVWGETHKPRDIFLLAAIGSLRGSGLASHLHIFESRTPTRAAVFVHDFP